MATHLRDCEESSSTSSPDDWTLVCRKKKSPQIASTPTEPTPPKNKMERKRSQKQKKKNLQTQIETPIRVQVTPKSSNEHNIQTVYSAPVKYKLLSKSTAVTCLPDRDDEPYDSFFSDSIHAILHGDAFDQHGFSTLFEQMMTLEQESSTSELYYVCERPNKSEARQLE